VVKDAVAAADPRGGCSRPVTVRKVESTARDSEA
jgi:hypothetical protein